MPADKRPSSHAQAIKECDEDMFPNISVLLKVACTSSNVLRSTSALRRLNNYMRVTMGKDRLSYLTLLHVHYDTDIDINDAVCQVASSED